MSQSHNLQASVDDISRSFNRVNLSESSVTDSYGTNSSQSGTKGEPTPQDPTTPSPFHDAVHKIPDFLIDTLNINQSLTDDSLTAGVPTRVNQHDKAPWLSPIPAAADCGDASSKSVMDGDEKYVDHADLHGEEATAFLRDIERSFQCTSGANFSERAPTPANDFASVDIHRTSRAGTNVQTSWPIPDPRPQPRNNKASSLKQERSSRSRFDPMDKSGRPSRSVRDRPPTPHPKFRKSKKTVGIKEVPDSAEPSLPLCSSLRTTQKDDGVDPLESLSTETGLDSRCHDSFADSPTLETATTTIENESDGDERPRAKPKEECDAPEAVPISRPLPDYESPSLSPSLSPSHGNFRSNPNPVPNLELEGTTVVSGIAENGENPTIGSYVGLNDVEMEDETKKNGQKSESITKRMMIEEDKPCSTYVEFFPIADEDVRMEDWSPVQSIASLRASAQPLTALHPDASLHAGHGQETWRQHLGLATNPPRPPSPPATRLPPPPLPPYTRISQHPYPPFSFQPNTNKMDDSPMDDDTQVTQTAPQPFIFQSFQSTNNAFGWGQAAQPQGQSQMQPVATPFSFNPQPAPVAPLPHSQYSDPNEAAAYNFWFTMLAKIREQEIQYQQQQLPMATLPPQFSQPPRPFTPMFELPSQPDGRPLVQRFSDDPPSPRFGGLRSRRSRKVEDRGFDPFHIGCGIRPLAPSSAIEGDIRVRGSEANLIHRLALEKRLEEEAKQRAAKERQVVEQAALLVKEHEKKRKVKKRRRNSSSRRSTGDSPRKTRTEHRANIERAAPETPTEASILPSTPTPTSVSRHEPVQETRRIKRQTFCPTFSMAMQRFLRAC